MVNIMPARSPVIASNTAEKLSTLGQQIRARRKALRISATATAEAAGMSRVTLHRVEHGEPSVTIGAYFSAMAVLGLDFSVSIPADQAAKKADDDRQGWIPARIKIADYPQLQQLAWQVHGTDELTPGEALSIYDRNWRHMDVQALEPRERHLIEALRLVLGESGRDV